MPDFTTILTKFIIWIGILLIPVKATMLSVGALVILDLITGLWASYKRGEIITSNGLRRTITKTLAYQLAVIASYIMETQFLFGVPVVHVVAGLIAVTEFKSFLENIGSITGLDFKSLLLEKLQGQKIIPELKSQVEAEKESIKVDNPD